jgi:hypothetical protein
MYHVEVEAHVVVEIIPDILDHILRGDTRERLIPVLQPAGIELGDHVWAYSAVVFVYHLLQIVHIVLAVGGRQYALQSAALEKPATVGGEFGRKRAW